MRIFIPVLGGLMLLAALYILVMNWACVIVSLRNKRKGIDRHHSTVPLVSALPAILAAAMLPRPWGIWALLIPVLDIANLNLLFAPVYLLIHLSRKPQTRKWVMMLLGLIAVVALIAYLTREREPSYQGKPLKFWVVQLVPMHPSSPSQPAAVEAVRHIGTNAIPYLLQWVRYEPSPSRPIADRVDWAVHQLPQSLQHFVPESVTDWVQGDWDYLKAWGAPEAFAILATAAAPAIPSLEAMLQDRTKTNTCLMAMYSLAAISTNVPPVMLARLADPDPKQRIRAIYGLGTYSAHVADAKPALPMLLNCLQDTNKGVRSKAIWALGSLKVPPELVIPALRSALNDPDEGDRWRATNALRKIDPEAFPNAPDPQPQ